jgi:hypothetical protein
MPDSRIPTAVPDLVPRHQVATYPTNFARMAADDLDALTTRGEQLTRALVDHYCPALGG